VQRKAAARLGYVLEWEPGCASEEWNAQVSLLAGHEAAVRMCEARVGLLRTMPPSDPGAVAAFRRAALSLGFAWPEEMSYARFIHSVDRVDPRAPVLFWQATRSGHGSDYVAFDGELPEHPGHAALAMVYAHATAPLRRLADRYVLDLLVELAAGRRPGAEETATLLRLPEVMNAADTRASRLERRVVDVAEAWTLRGRVGETFEAVVLSVRGGTADVQMGDHPVRASFRVPAGTAAPGPGATVRVRLASADVEAGKLGVELVP
jgi:exoribonuclease R